MTGFTSKTVIECKTFGEAFLELLFLRGIELVLANTGTDLAGIVEAFAIQKTKGRVTPRPVLVPHEIPLSAMAYGYFLAKKKPAVAMVHGTVGTINTLGIMMTAKRNRIPIIFVAGSMPSREKGKPSRFLVVHWVQDIMDQKSVVRDFVKGYYEIKSYDQLEETFDRAYTICMTEPKGPVYLILPPEVMFSKPGKMEFARKPIFSIPTTLPDPIKVKDLAQMLSRASFPIIITSSLGRDPEAVYALMELTEVISLGVISFVPEYMNFPITHPFHLGFSPDKFLSMSDLILVADCDVPWIPVRKSPRYSAIIAHLGDDPLFFDIPFRGFRSDITIKGSTASILSELTRICKSLTIDKSKIEERKKLITEMHKKIFGELKNLAIKCQNTYPFNPAWVSYNICGLMDENCIIVNEYDNKMVPYINLKPGNYFCSPHTGYLGWAFGVSLGIKIACPEKTVIATMGDGSYLFSVPSACHYVSMAYNLPILSIIYNNIGWDAVRRTTRLFYPHGEASRTGSFPLADFIPGIKYEKICEAFAGYGERLDQPGELMPALKRALEKTRLEKKQVLLNVICST